MHRVERAHLAWVKFARPVQEWLVEPDHPQRSQQPARQTQLRVISGTAECSDGFRAQEKG